jgi:peptide deformylase
MGEKMTARILRVAQMGHPILREISQSVEDVSDPEIQRLIDDMLATVEYLNCTGLAAPQVFTPLRIVVFRVLKTTNNPAYRLTPQYDPEGVPLTVMINPTLTPLSNEMSSVWESCLSLPVLMGRVPRYHSIEYNFMNREGQMEKKVAHGFHAQAVQHECDHLDGILYPDKLEDRRDFGFREEILKYRF